MYRILVAENEDLIRNGLVFSIDWESLGCYKPLAARNGGEAVQIIEEHSPDIVLLDINMPVFSGLEVLEKTHGTADYETIIITGYSEFEYARQAIEYDVCAYLVKPVDLEDLKLAIEKSIHRIDQRSRFTVMGAELNKLEQQIVPQELSGVSEPVCNMVAYVKMHYMDKVTLAMIAQELHYSERMLIRRFKKEMKMNFSSFLTHVRLQKAMSLMRETYMSISEISTACGFSDYRYFCKVFQNKIGCSPSHFAQYAREQD